MRDANDSVGRPTTITSPGSTPTADCVMCMYTFRYRFFQLANFASGVSVPCPSSRATQFMNIALSSASSG